MAAYSETSMHDAGVILDLIPHRQQKAERRKYKRSLYWFGFTEIILGIASCGISIVGLVVASAASKGYMTYVSSGLWCGLFMMASGILGVRVSAQSSPCAIKANMAASTLSSIFMGIMFVMSMLAALSDHHALMAIYVFLGIIASAGFILNIVHAAFCCATICCINPATDYHVVQSSTRGPIVRYMLVSGRRLVPVGYPGPPHESRREMPPLLEPPSIHHHDPNKLSEPSTPPPAYTSRENLNAVPSTSS